MPTDNYNVENDNDNMDIIDAQLKLDSTDENNKIGLEPSYKCNHRQDITQIFNH